MTGSSKSSKPKVWLISLAAVVFPAPMLPARATKRLALGRRARSVLRVLGSGAVAVAGSGVGAGSGGAAGAGGVGRLRETLRGMGSRPTAREVSRPGSDAADPD